ncbi:ABC-2 transporter permease [bacterium 1XD42-54]|jgi:ABC-2 type transport system permease protein|nr:ABC-2 transporter permease [bacterium 1XD42-54]
MMSLVYKDFMNLRVQAKLYALIIAVWTVVAGMEKNPSFLGGVLSIFSILIAITSCAYDERAGWDKYALTMPIGKRELVLSKYVVSFLILGVGMLVFTGLNLYLQTEPMEFLGQIGIFVALGLLAADIVLPIIFRFGTEKGRTFLMLIFLVPAVLGLVLGELELPLKVTLTEMELSIGMLGVGILLLPLSMWMSFRMYGRRDMRSNENRKNSI